MFMLIGTLGLAGLPPAYEIDFRTLAGSNSSKDYTIILSFKGEPDVRMPFFYAKQYKPDEIADGLMDTLNDPAWKLKKTGDVVTIAGYDDVRIAKVTIVGKDPKPALRRVVWLGPAKVK